MKWLKHIIQPLLIYPLSIVVFLFGCSMAPQSNDYAPTGQSEHQFQITERHQVSLAYLLYIPEGYNENQDEWPLLVYLHGKGECGADLERVKAYGPPKLVDNGKDLPFIIVSPQCPPGQRWPNLIVPLNLLLDEIEASYRVDSRRIYLTGLSMGGFGCWSWGCANPERFAAIAPVCGGGDVQLACELKDVPLWVFHGAKDDVVPLKRSQEMVEALGDCGGKVRFTVYPESGHDSWTETYDNPEVYQWFLGHKR